MNVKELKVGDRVKANDNFGHRFTNPDRVWTVMHIDNFFNVEIKGDEIGDRDWATADFWTIRDNFEEWQIVKPEITDLI